MQKQDDATKENREKCQITIIIIISHYYYFYYWSSDRCAVLNKTEKQHCTYTVQARTVSLSENLKNFKWIYKDKQTKTQVSALVKLKSETRSSSFPSHIRKWGKASWEEKWKMAKLLLFSLQAKLGLLYQYKIFMFLLRPEEHYTRG